ncbi:predicted protein [Naegleria gruberi]|uniref:Predicted protein n=1 Tax=Naegleria gruberi TaxID=5762 RepID=D2V7L0_NAEGR|nr:uncharacterized protein NAEGRDRAFT_64841 [Naegleria gruberi]EFC47399.1 predicted protein [Naegleria gruberi]|eukprot:XP_002680143.1 predicted protein [Naegleria gruberi strain NEG-M]
MFTSNSIHKAISLLALLCCIICLSSFSLAVPVNRKGNFVQIYKFLRPGCLIKDLNTVELFHATSMCYREKYGWSNSVCNGDYGIVQSLCTKGCGRCDSTRNVKVKGCVNTATESTLTACGPLVIDIPDDMLWRLSYPWGDYASSCDVDKLAPINVVSAKGQRINSCGPVANSFSGEYSTTTCTNSYFTTTTYKDSGCKKPVGGYYGSSTGLLRCERYSDFKYTCNV